MKHRSGSNYRLSHQLRRLLCAAAPAVVMLSVSAFAAGAPARPVSSCVACHLDAERLKTEAAKVVAPPASALQAGKG